MIFNEKLIHLLGNKSVSGIVDVEKISVNLNKPDYRAAGLDQKAILGVNADDVIMPKLHWLLAQCSEMTLKARTEQLKLMDELRKSEELLGSSSKKLKVSLEIKLFYLSRSRLS